ncbi:40S ribosomal protein S11 [Tritrichomonas foetus]|uniref:40S ribosomal protein S11 n=1 Tax=Tritrichomonas foetus TaxID=1144522 RepID=A0A1J4JTI8_9EUKA|nr:40S ribosomal protein S11 [Tritrichomonas foetus]|eukprot:OHT00812.1 40S ribosomal protein S11 [Tritrichomonas foetus]
MFVRPICKANMKAKARYVRMSDTQNERAFQKQPQVFLASKRYLNSEKKPRYFKNIGLNIQTPAPAKEGDFIDRKCPFTGNVTIRGRLVRGVVVSTKMRRTIIVRRDYLHWIRKYKRFEKRHTKMPAHCSPAFVVKEGDIVQIGECRPLSKTVHFNIVSVKPCAVGADKKQFRVF